MFIFYGCRQHLLALCNYKKFVKLTNINGQYNFIKPAIGRI